MLILVGLGNPGAKYAGHRHNVGYMAVDAIAERHGFSPPRSKFQADLRDGALTLGGRAEKAIILKPTTFMNDSGQSVGAAMRFYKAAPGDIVVFHDELDLAAGKVRVKTGGGAAGHNGIRSVSQHIGADFRRVRIGIGHPGEKHLVSPHVLGDFAKADHAWLDPLLDAIAQAAPFLAESDARFATEVARLSAPARERSGAKSNNESRSDPPQRATGDAAQTHKEPAKRGPLTDALHKLFGDKD